jgi:(R,R)-butanediol dehydrogenase / meso-butanediol dehydrogenase / diacetyl reductase
MKAGVYYGPRDVRVEQVPEPAPGPNEIKVKVKYCGICDSDLHEYLHGPFPRSPFGHEACGQIVGLVQGVERFQEGDEVMAFQKGVDFFIKIRFHKKDYS